MTIIDNITQAHGASDITFDHAVTSQDCVLVVSLGNHQGGPLSPGDVQYNGSNLIKLATSSTAFNETAEIWIMTNPPIGTYPLFVRNVGGASGSFAAAMSIRGIAKNFSSVPNGATNGTSTQPAVTLNPGFGDCFIIDCYYSEADGGNTRQEQTQWANQQGQSFENGGSSYRYIGSGPETVDMRWTLSSSQRWAQVVVALPVNKAYSIADPSISIKNIRDVNVQDTQYQNAVSKLGYQPSTFYQNSFLHTVGRIFDPTAAGSGPNPLGINQGFNAGSRIVVANYVASDHNGNLTPRSINFNIQSPDEVLVVIAANNNNSAGYTADINGTPFPFNVTNQSTNGSITIFYITNPPVGNNTITVRSSGNILAQIYAISFLGVNKEKINPLVSTNNAASGSSIINSIQIDSPNSLILDATYINSGNPLINTVEQSVITNFSGHAFSSSLRIAQPGVQSMSWKTTSSPANFVTALIVLEPAHAPSYWFPNITTREIQDVIFSRQVGSTNDINIGYFPNTFFQNSFLHTIGRIGQANPVVGTIVAETEQETSQIIIDKIFQGQVPAQALSQVSLTMDVSIPSPDAVLVITGGSVIVTGAKWASVQFNGNPLTNLVQASVAGADAEIWYYPFPPVGVGQLTITSGTGGEIYANAMVLLGVDKRSTNIMTASSTDAASTSTIGALITPDAPNSLVIDTLAALDATASPVWDSSQTQVFNATALASSEYVLSTYKIASAQQNMNYNLSVAVNAALVAVSFRPAQAPSQWFPNIDFREIDDTVTVAGLDAEINPSFGQYGYKPTLFYKNSFLHTMGRIVQPQVLDHTGPLTDSLIAYYSFDENSGTTLYDKTNTSPPLLIQGDTSNFWKVNGKINSTGVFNGSNNYAVVNQFNLPTSAIAYSLWVKITNTNSSFPHLFSIGGNDSVILFLDSNGQVDVKFQNIGGTAVQINQILPTVNFGQWYHIAVTYDGATVSAYANGVLAGTASVSGSINYIDSSFWVGSSGSISGGTNNDYFSGSLDEFGIWSRSLSSYEILNIFNLGKGLKYPFLPNSNDVNFGIQRYNFYNEGQNAYAERNWQKSFLYTIGRYGQPLTFDQTGPLTNGLVSYWSFNENTGNVTKDSLHNNDGNWYGTLDDHWRINGKINSSGNFNGNDSYVGFLSSLFYNQSPFAYSLSFWVFPKSFGSGPRFICLGNSGSNTQVWIIEAQATNNGNITLLIRNNGNVTILPNTTVSGLSLNQNQWNHVVVTDNNGNLNLYINGVLDPTNFSYTPNGVFTFNQTGFGALFRAAATNFLDGYMEEIGLWNRALASYEVFNLYNLGKGLTFPFLPNGNNTNFSIQSYSYYNEGLNAYAERNWQSSFLQTVGRNIPFSPAATKLSSTLMMMGMA